AAQEDRRDVPDEEVAAGRGGDGGDRRLHRGGVEERHEPRRRREGADPVGGAIMRARRLLPLAVLLLAAGPFLQAGEQPTRERKRPPLPEIKAPVMFDTPEADAILAALQVFPPDNPWNEDVSGLPVLPNSDKIIAGVGADKSLAYNLDMGFILVPPDQKKVPV